MKATLLPTLITVFYWSWIPVLVAHVILNYVIFHMIGKEEFKWPRNEGDAGEMMLAIFNFRWNKAYQEDDNPLITRLMRISNVLSIVFIIYTAAVFFIWIFNR